MGGAAPGTNSEQAAAIDDKQLEHLQEELENHKCKILSKDSSISLLKNRLESKDQETNQLRTQIEKLNRSIKDLTSSQKISIRFNEEKLSKKQKELETILKDKKCKNCPICLEGMNLNFQDSIDLITDLNKNLLGKSQENEGLLEQLNKSNKLMADICSHNFLMLRQKTQDFLKSHDQLKSRYERKLM